MDNKYSVTKTVNFANHLQAPTYSAVSSDEFIKIQEQESQMCSFLHTRIIYVGEKDECINAARKCNDIKSRNPLVYNHNTVEIPGTDGDMYTGSFTNKDSSIKYVYNLAFAKGSKSTGHIVVGFKIFTVDKFWNMTSLDGNDKGTINVKYLDVLEELLKGF